jgi:uncharacterized protein (DUF58 family)
MTSGQRVILALLVLSLLAGLATGNALYYRLSVLWTLLYVGSWLWSITALQGIKFIRYARTLKAQVGQIFEERFEIHNPAFWPRIWLEVQDNSTLPGNDGSRVLTVIPGRQGRSYLARTRLVQRGVFPLGPTILSSGDLFGLFPVTITLPPRDSLLVYPMMVDVRGFPNPPGLLPGGESLRQRTHQITPNAAGVREYEPGDPINRIHWVSTARRNRLMVKEFELDPLADVWIFLDAARNVQAALPDQPPEKAAKDLWQRAAKIALPPSTEEYAVSIAASLARDYLRRGRAVGLAASGQHLALLPPDRGGRQLGKILEALALLKAEGSLPLKALIEIQVKHMVRGSTVVLITPALENDIALITDYLLRRGQRPVVVLLDAKSFGGRGEIQLVQSAIRSLGVRVWAISNGVDLANALSNGYHRTSDN